MSFDALAWAAKCRVAKSTDKLVLLGLAECADRATNRAFPSIDALVEFGSLNRKTVIAALDRLEVAGLISPTGEHVGRTKQIKVYVLKVGTVPKTEQYQKRNSPVFTPKQSQKRDTEPVMEPVPTEAKASSGKRAREVFVLPESIPAANWAAYLEMRKAIRKPMTAQAMALAVGKLNRLAEAGYPPGDVLDQSTMNAWQGLFEIKDGNHGNNRNFGGSGFTGSRSADGLGPTARAAIAAFGHPDDDPGMRTMGRS